MTVIDANNLILGRMASTVAQRILNGEQINIINAEKAIISGRKDATFDRYHAYVARGSREFGPRFPRRARPDSGKNDQGYDPAYKNLRKRCL
ncbi:MAG: LSU ribosomal protein L13P [Candidatus Methanoperedens nitroreducens]|uniref:LSU ribosomal protein L13P n=1 Tax=Candidatus Methanoperedens nitratireducens TaxID=1392998 RepID=A0A0P7ZFB8_9EURY|nr:MAG: LSU ribosomal protein L13P [Candidatus Methanoperedens sp. BLZ1]